MDLSKMCRACLATTDSYYYHLFDNITSDMFIFCTAIQLYQTDQLPKSLCHQCYDLVNKFCYFKQQCIQSNDTLVQCLENNTALGSNCIELDLKPALVSNQTETSNSEDLTAENFLKLEHNDVNHFVADYENNDHLLSSERQQSPEIPHKHMKRLKNRSGINPLKIKKEKAISNKKTRIKRNFDYPCAECNRKFAFPERLEAHRLTHLGQEMKIRCEICDKDFKAWDGLSRHNEHLHVKISLETLKCKTCGKLFKTTHTLKRHQAIHEERKLSICHICGRTFKSPIILQGHLETHKEDRERSHVCKICGKTFFTMNLLSTHVSRRHSGKRYICHVCNYPFVDKYNLTKHLLIHEGIKPFACDICLKAYSTVSFLREHKRMHTGERPFSCDYCTKSFISKKRLIDHRRIHTGEKPYKCHKCSQAFIQRGTLKRHLKVHNK